MKRTVCMAAGLLILLGAMAANAQSLGDVARKTRKSKAQQTAATRQYDNDNLPKNSRLSVVGPEAPAASEAQAESAAPANASDTASPNPAPEGGKDGKTSAEQPQKESDGLQQKLADQKKKVDDLTHELDLLQRENKMRAAVFYSDAGNRLRDSAQWDKDDAQHKQEIADKQKALEAAQHELEATQDEARKAGIRPKDNE